MRYCSIALLGVAVLLGAIASAQTADQGKKKGARARGLATVGATGELVCAHCELGIGDTCSSALKVDKVVFLLDGKIGEELFDNRREGELKTVSGTLAVKDGQLHLTGRKVIEPKDKSKVKPRTYLAGQLLKVGDGLSVKNGKTAILLTGDAAKKLTDLVGKRVRVSGDFSINKDKKVTVSVKRGQIVEPKNDGPKKKKA